jgi:seryl-tRNA synthetase
MSFAAAKCYDLELWAPGFNGWLEVSSCSNFEVPGAPRRHSLEERRRQDGVRPHAERFGRGPAAPRGGDPRKRPAADVSVVLPEALRPYMAGWNAGAAEMSR